jgi:hypothetical protein
MRFDIDHFRGEAAEMEEWFAEMRSRRRTDWKKDSGCETNNAR